MSNGLETPSATLSETDVLPVQLKDTGDNPADTLLNFLGLAVMADFAKSALEHVGHLGGGVEMPSSQQSPAAGLEFGYELGAQSAGMDGGPIPLNFK